MPRRTLADERIRSTITDAAKLALAPETFGNAVLHALQDHIPYDSARMFGVDPGSLLLNRLISASTADEPYRRYWLRNIYMADAESSYFTPHLFLREGGGAITYLPAQDDCWGTPDSLRAHFTPKRHTSYFHDSLTPIGGSMRLGLRARGSWIGLIDIARRDASRPFSAQEFDRYRALGRLIGQGLDAALLRESASSPVMATTGGSGVVYFAADRRVVLQTPAADAWLAAMHDCEPVPPGEMCTPMTALISAWHSPVPHAPALTMTVRSTAGMLQLEATAGQAPGEISVVIAPLNNAPSVQAPAHWPLTERQREIAELLLLGTSTKEIARKLGIGIPTVETHLGNIYGALGVQGRHALLARYFMTVIRPGID